MLANESEEAKSILESEDKPKSNINMQTSENYNEFNYFGGSNNILKL